jgi:membrane-bound lytic murein transglycosylase D
MPTPSFPVAYDGSDIWGRLGQGFSLVDDNGINQRIARQRDWLLANPRFLRNASQRAGPYLHYIAESLDQRRMPAELALLPIVESAYNPKANSIRDAAGLWQFMAATGRDYNLRQTAWYDGRRDVVASSKAAMDYLTRLHDQFNGDWLLAMAAYNAGEGTVARAIEANQRRGLPGDYWHLDLPRETQDYVPRLLALSLLVREPEVYGVQLSPVANAPYFTAIELARPVDLSQLAASAGIDEAVLLGLNPAFLRKKTVDGPNHLLVPREQARQLSVSLAKMLSEASDTPTEALAVSATPMSPSVRLLP